MPLEQKHLCDSCFAISTPEELVSKYLSPEGVAGMERDILHCPGCGSSDLFDWTPQEARRRLDTYIEFLGAPIFQHIHDLILEMEETYIDEEG